MSDPASIQDPPPFVLYSTTPPSTNVLGSCSNEYAWLNCSFAPAGSAIEFFIDSTVSFTESNPSPQAIRVPLFAQPVSGTTHMPVPCSASVEKFGFTLVSKSSRNNVDV